MDVQIFISLKEIDLIQAILVIGDFIHEGQYHCFL
jgi:hypothetical protein